MKFLLFMTLLGAAVAQASTEAKEYDAKTVHSFEIESVSGDIRIEGGHEEKARIEVTRREFDKSCRIDYKQKGNELTVKIRRTGGFKRSDCKADIVVHLPKVVDLEIKAGVGAITVTGTKGAIDFKVGSGELTVDADVHELEGSGGSAKVTVKSLTGKGDIKMGSGLLDVTYGSVPATGKFSVTAGSSVVNLTFPAQAKLSTKFVSFGGKMNSEFPETADAGFKVQVTSGSSSLNIKKAP